MNVIEMKMQAETEGQLIEVTDRLAAVALNPLTRASAEEMRRLAAKVSEMAGAMMENEAYLDKLAYLEAKPHRTPWDGVPRRASWFPLSDEERAEKLTAIARREKRLRAEKEEIRLAIPRAVAAGRVDFSDACDWIKDCLTTPQDDPRFTGALVSSVMLEGSGNDDGLTRWGAALKEHA